MTIDGPVVLDIVQHFVERWNEVKLRKVCPHRLLTSIRTNILVIVQGRQVCYRFLFFPVLLLITAIFQSHYEWLALPHNVAVAPNEAIVRHPHREHWQQIGRQFKQRFHRPEDRDDDPDNGHYSSAPHGTCRVQVVRSVSDWSHGVLTEHSIQNACERKEYILHTGSDKVLQIYS